MIDVLRSTTSRGRLLVGGQSDCTVMVKAAERHQQLLGRLARAVQAGRQRKIKACVYTILNSPESRLSALVRTIFYDEHADPYSVRELCQRARELHPHGRNTEGVKVYYREKAAGDGWRPVVSFGWRRRALQALCADILRICLPSYQFDFMEKGNGGADGAAQRLGQIIKEGNYARVLTIDIKNCFGSVQKEGAAELLPLPGSVVRNALLIQDDVETSVELRNVEGNTYTGCPTLVRRLLHEADTAARLGIPQGSLASNLIMSRGVLGPKLYATPFVDRLVLHGDDIAVAAKNEEEAESIYNTLRTLLECSGRAGPLTIGRHKIWSPDEYVDFCKYKIKRTALVFGGEVRFSPSTPSLRRYDQKVERIYVRAKPGEEDEKVEQYTAAWQMAYPLWMREFAEDNIKIGEIQAKADAWRKKCGKS